MTLFQSSTDRSGPQGSPSRDPGRVETILDAVDATSVLERLQEYRWTGRQGYPLRTMWRAYLASFVLNLPHTNALIRRLHEDPELRRICGFGDSLPHRSTFNRFISRLGYHRDLVGQCMAPMTTALKARLPGFGDIVAVDSTTVRTHSNPERQELSDTEAGWTAKTVYEPQLHKEWYFGYKYHAVVDATHGLPITGFTTPANVNDSPKMPELLDRASRSLRWFQPKYVLADKGYDAQSNYRNIVQRGASPIIPIRRTSRERKKLHQGIYTGKAVPTCIGMEPMEYVRSDPEKGRLYRCRAEGCRLKDRPKVEYCEYEVWDEDGSRPECVGRLPMEYVRSDPQGARLFRCREEGCRLKDRLKADYCEYEIWDKGDPDNPRLFPPIPRGDPEWDELYARRQSIERMFKSLKESRRLERHCVRGLRQVALHAAMSVLSYQATALANLRAGETDLIRWMVPKVA